MEYRKNLTKYEYTRFTTYERHEPYDYARKGLLTRCLPKVITETQNQTTRAVLQFVENSMIFLLKYVDELKHFKNWNFRKY